VSYLLIYLFINTDTHSIANNRKQNFSGHRRLLLHITLMCDDGGGDDEHLRITEILPTAITGELQVSIAIGSF